MNPMNLLEQMLRSGAGALSGVGQTASGRKDLLVGAAGGGLLGLLIGSRRGRSIGGKVLKVGSIAALGALAYHAYQQHQARQGAATPAAPGGAAAAPLAALPAPLAEAQGRALLKAMIAAAKSDGHVDDRERELLEVELQRLPDPELRAWVDAELRRPLDPADVAAGVDTPERAAEVYLASVVVADEQTPMERAYLDALARSLKLPPDLQADLEAQARAA